MTALYNLLEMGRGVGQLQNVLFSFSWKTEHLSPNEEERELAVHCVQNPDSYQRMRLHKVPSCFVIQVVLIFLFFVT